MVDMYIGIDRYQNKYVIQIGLYLIIKSFLIRFLNNSIIKISSVSFLLTMLYLTACYYIAEYFPDSLKCISFYIFHGCSPSSYVFITISSYSFYSFIPKVSLWSDGQVNL